jgi:hypothetical protein
MCKLNVCDALHPSLLYDRIVLLFLCAEVPPLDPQQAGTHCTACTLLLHLLLLLPVINLAHAMHAILPC